MRGCLPVVAAVPAQAVDQPRHVFLAPRARPSDAMGQRLPSSSHAAVEVRFDEVVREICCVGHQDTAQ